jgi:hypothetical protein
MLSQACLYCSGRSFGDFSLILSTAGQLLSLSLVNTVSFSPLQSPWSSVTQGPFTAPVPTGYGPCPASIDAFHSHLNTSTRFYSSLPLTLSKSLKIILFILLHLPTPCPLPRNPLFSPFLPLQVKTIDFGLIISSPGFNSTVSGALSQAKRRN